MAFDSVVVGGSDIVTCSEMVLIPEATVDSVGRIGRVMPLNLSVTMVLVDGLSILKVGMRNRLMCSSRYGPWLLLGLLRFLKLTVSMRFLRRRLMASSVVAGIIFI